MKHRLMIEIFIISDLSYLKWAEQVNRASI